MSDPLEQLERFRREVEGGPMLSAAEVRRRGDRLRRRTTALRTGVTGLAVAAIAVPLALTADHDRHDRGFTHDPTPVVHGVGAANVLADDETVGDAGGHWVREYDTPDDGQDAFNPCARTGLADLGATSVYRRSWHSAGSSRPAGSLDELDEIVGQFPGHHDAGSASNTIAGWVRQCAVRLGDSASAYTVASDNSHVAGADMTVHFIQSSYSPQGAPAGRFVETGIVVVANRLAVLTWQYDGQDFTSAPTLVQRMVRTVQARLGGGTLPAGSQDPPPANPPASWSPPARGAGSGPATAIPDGFPLAEVWDRLQSEGGRGDGLHGPSRSLAPDPITTACGTTYRRPAHEDQQVVTWIGPEDGRERDLTTYADADAAAAAVQALVDLFRACPQHATDPPGYVAHYEVERTATSGDSWALSQYYTVDGHPGIGLQVFHVIRVGLAVLVVSQSNEGGQDAVQRQVREMTDDARPTIDAMCVFTEAGC